MARIIRFSGGFQMFRGATRAGGKNPKFFKKSVFPVDGLFSMATLFTPPEAGPGSVGVVLAYFGTANWNSILSRHDERQPASAESL
jgi:hypothetical protein